MLSGNFTWLFHPEDFFNIREIRPYLTVNNYLTTENNLDTRTFDTGIDVEFHNGSLFQAWQEQTREILKNNFVPFPGRVIGQGDYGYGFCHFSYTHDNTRIVSPNMQFEKGEYYNGHRTKWGGGLKFHPNAHISLETSIQRDQVEIPSGSYGLNLMLWRVNYSFTTRMFLDALIQYNSLTGQVNSNIRFNLIHHPLSDLFIVYNDNRDRRSGDPINRVLSIKFTQLFDF
jgi:hypothetical protein